MTLDECYAVNQGKALLIPGGGAGNEGQCVQWADTVLHDVYGLDYHWGNAIDWWNSPGELLNHFDKVTDGSVKKGDFVIFNTQVGSQYGHIDVAMQDGTTANFQGADSNWGGNKTVHLVQHSNPNYVLGSLRLKNQGEEMVTPEDVYALFQGFRNRQPNQSELDQFVGKWTYSALIKALNSGPDRDKVVHQLVTGITAEQDDWAGQIASLQKQVSGDATVLKPGKYEVK